MVGNARVEVDKINQLTAARMNGHTSDLKMTGIRPAPVALKGDICKALHHPPRMM